MALNGNNLGISIASAIDGLSDTDKLDINIIWKAIANEIITHIKDNAEVSTTVANGIGVQVNTATGTGATTSTGSGTGGIS